MLTVFDVVKVVFELFGVILSIPLILLMHVSVGLVSSIENAWHDVKHEYYWDTKRWKRRMEK